VTAAPRRGRRSSTRPGPRVATPRQTKATMVLQRQPTPAWRLTPFSCTCLRTNRSGGAPARRSNGDCSLLPRDARSLARRTQPRQYHTPYRICGRRGGQHRRRPLTVARCRAARFLRLPRGFAWPTKVGGSNRNSALQRRSIRMAPSKFRQVGNLWRAAPLARRAGMMPRRLGYTARGMVQKRDDEAGWRNSTLGTGEFRARQPRHRSNPQPVTQSVWAARCCHHDDRARPKL